MLNKPNSKKSLLVAIDRNRIFILFTIVFLFMALFAPRFFNVFNLTTIMRTSAMNATVAIGFTVILIIGQLDLSIGTIITFTAIIGLGLKEYIGFGGSIPVAIIAGGLIGLINGLLVAKAKINSFIVTLGMMTALQGAIYTFTGGNSVSLSTPDAFAVSDWLALMIFPLVTPRVIITLVLIAASAIFMKRTRIGRNFYMVGGNRQTAWLAGIDTDKYTIAAFIMSGVTAGIGGVLFAMESAAATLNMGNSSLMYVISAAIIGGTAMSGGKGGIFKTFVAILMLDVLYNGIILFGLGNEVKIFIAGIILASVVLYEAYVSYKHEKVIGQRPELMKELEVQNQA
ncbi:MAG: ABC transporter permease [Spirochaetales bacterium]|nr:ABC transporter permease [Spirochaetales bacterium]